MEQMTIQDDFYAHVVAHAGSDGPLLARIALNLGFDASAYPVHLDEIAGVGQYPRLRTAYLLNELLLMGYMQLVVTKGARHWTPEEVEMLAKVADFAPMAKLYSIAT